MALIRIAVGVDRRDFDAVHEADRVDAHLAIVITIVGAFYGGSVENARRIPKSDAMPADVRGVFGRIPREPHPDLYEMYLPWSRCEVPRHDLSRATSRRQGGSFDMMIVPEAANLPPTPWQTEILAPGIYVGAMPRIWRTLSWSAYIPYMPECM